MEKPRFNDPSVFPSDNLLKPILGSAYKAYEELWVRMAESGLEPIWNYYRDGGAWLCKAQFKKKTVFWLSVWEGSLKITFYFTEKTLEGLSLLPIEESLFEEFSRQPAIGKFLPMTFRIGSVEQLDDLMRVAEYKKKLK